MVRAKYFGLCPRLATLRVLAPLHIKNTLSGVKTLVRAKGLEPSTSTLARLRSSQLSYARIATGIITYLFTHCKYFLSHIFILFHSDRIQPKLATHQFQLFFLYLYIFFFFSSDRLVNRTSFTSNIKYHLNINSNK